MSFLFSFQGRIRRTGFALFYVALLGLVGAAASLAAMVAMGTGALVLADSEIDAVYEVVVAKSVAGAVGVGVSLLVLAFLVLVAWMKLAVAAKRLHDMGTSGWLVLLGFVPGVNLLLVLALVFWPGTRGPNPYGADPRGDDLFAVGR